ncbi:hypothetical protein RBEMOGI_0594 [Rickettsia bellii str. RML Mogi]|uniref:Uncharacterized protein n=1 Tax=Rickettsia bellii str. RML Mogi TaxID=1359194 RepID=A0A0F3QIJ1_RICBE|nr:hypothetical protein RBEMOGI_0594 [Rickettsia bellii str. RML Mogi]
MMGIMFLLIIKVISKWLRREFVAFIAEYLLNI